MAGIHLHTHHRDARIEWRLHYATASMTFTLEIRVGSANLHLTDLEVEDVRYLGRVVALALSDFDEGPEDAPAPR